MEKQNRPDALDRALTDLYRTDVPESYRAGWRAAVKREEQIQMKKQPLPKKTLWRVALPIAAALVLVFGAISAGNLIPTVMNDTFYSQPAPQPDAQKGTGGNQYAADSGAMESFADTAAYDTASVSAAPPMSGSFPHQRRGRNLERCYRRNQRPENCAHRRFDHRQHRIRCGFHRPHRTYPAAGRLHRQRERQRRGLLPHGSRCLLQHAHPQ